MRKAGDTAKEAGQPSPSSLRWRLLRQSLLRRSDCSSQEQTKQISRKPAGGFGLVSNHIVEPKVDEYPGARMHAMPSTGTKDMLVEYNLPSCKAAGIMLLQRRENYVDLRDFEISEEHKIDNTGVVCLWPSEEVLTYICVSNADMFRNKTVLELGSGYGLAGLAIAAYTNAAQVVISDGNPQVVNYIQRNIDANVGSFNTTKVTSMLLKWSEGELCDWGQSFDFILAADCTFFKDCHIDLARTLKSLLQLSKTSRAILLSPRRGNTLDLFLETVGNLDLHVKVVEKYDNHIWELHTKFIENNSTWPNYDKEHFYPLLITISLESELLFSSQLR